MQRDMVLSKQTHSGGKSNEKEQLSLVYQIVACTTEVLQLQKPIFGLIAFLLLASSFCNGAFYTQTTWIF
jgi:hypothetical protein